MSLIHWWPLNGDTRDNGTNAGGITSSVTFSNPGKIGRCADLNNYQVDTNVPIRSVMLGECSLSLWIKVPETAYRNVVNSYSYDSEHQLYNTRIIGTGGGYGNSGFSLHLYSNNIYNEGSLTSINLQYGWRDDSEAPFEAGPTISFDTWYHIAITKDSSKKCRMYVNGILWGTYQATNGDIEESYLYLNTGVVYSWGAYRNGHSPIFLNDVRVYDHCLSAREVKEISKGLVLHYNFEDPYIEGTTNLASWDAGGWDNSGSSTRNYNDTSFTIKPCLGSKVISIVRNDAGDGCITFGNMSVGSLQGKTVTASTWVYLDGNITPTAVYLRSAAHDGSIVNLSYNGSVSVENWPKNKWIYVTGTGNVASDETGMYLCSYSTNAGEKRAFNGWQIEAKDHATPWVANGTTRSPGKVYDNSGYRYDGTQDGNLQILDGSASGNLCAYFNGNTLIKANALTSEGRTACLWYKGSFPNANKVIFADSGSKLACGFLNGNCFIVSSQEDYQNYFLSSGYKNDDWNFIVVIRGTSRNSSKMYLNGVELSVAGTEEWWTHSGGLWLGGRSAETSTNITGQIADFKIYATALSAEDILAEYKRKASIDKTGKMFAGEVVEKLINNIKITSSSIVKSSHFAEGTGCVKLVDNYTRLEYIESTGTQYINTAYTTLANDEIELEVDVTDNTVSWKALYGARKANYLYNCNVFFASLRNEKHGCYARTGNEKAGVLQFPYAEKVKIITQNNTASIYRSDGLYETIVTTGTIDDCYNSLAIFALNQAETSDGFVVEGTSNSSFKLYSFKISSNGNYVRNFVPVKRNSDNVVGLYDIVNRHFYANDGSGLFIAGPEIAPLNVLYAKELIEY